MPIYEYECKKCGKIEEAFQKISDAPLEKCSHCEGRLNKIVSHSSFHLKGSGWYVTDYGGTTSKSEKTSNDDKNSGSKTEGTSSNIKCNRSCSGSNSKAE